MSRSRLALAAAVGVGLGAFAIAGATVPWPNGTFSVASYELVGGTEFDAATRERLVAGGVGPAVTLEQIAGTMTRVRRAYLEWGFLAVDVRLPQQALRDGVVRLEVHEGPRTVAEPPPPSSQPLTFEVRRYDVIGNTRLADDVVENVFREAVGPAVTLDQVRRAAGQLQLAYRERGYVTVAVGLPPQQIREGRIRMEVTEGMLTDVRVVGARSFSSNNVVRALPSLRTNALLNGPVFQRELDLANQNRDRQIYPTLGPGPDPGTSELTLRVEDALPLHGRLEMNNASTPGTPEWRLNASLQYLNLWQREHQMGISYGGSPEAAKAGDLDHGLLFNAPQIAYAGAFYRLPLGAPESVAEAITAGSGFGYDEASRQFRLPPAGARPDLTFFASVSGSDTGVQHGPASVVQQAPLLTIVSQDAGRNLAETLGVGARYSRPFALAEQSTLTLAFGLDEKHYRLTRFNTNHFLVTTVVTNAQGTQTLETDVPSPQPTRRDAVDTVPLSASAEFSRGDARGRSFAGVTVVGNFVGSTEALAALAYTSEARPAFGRALVQLGREQRLSADWWVAVRASGQGATGPLLSQEQFVLGGVGSVRGYFEGDEYGDAGWFASAELRSPWLRRRVAFGTRSAPVALRGWIFADAGQRWLLASADGVDPTALLSGVGAGVSANLDNHFDLRVIVGWPLIDTPSTTAGDPRAYLSVGGQF